MGLPAPHPWGRQRLLLVAEAIFQRKKLGVQFGEGLPQFCQFFFGPVNFQPGEFGYFQCFIQKRSHTLSRCAKAPSAST